MAGDRIRDAYHQLLAPYLWTFMVCLTFRRTTSKAVAKLRYERWFNSLQQNLTVPLDSVCVVEQGKASGHTHVHVLLAGIPPTERVARQLQQAWPYGVADVRKIDPTKREQAIGYVLKTVSSSDSDQLEVTLSHRSSTGSSPQQPEPIRDSRPGPSNESRPQAAPPSEAQISTETITIPSIRFRRGSGFHVHRDGDYLVIALPLTTPRPSSTGKTNIVGSTGGPRPTLAEFDGWPISANVVLTVKPKGPAWKQRIAPLLARWEGKLS